eukprot:5996890-Pyramimonas_sp.AAC.1
MLAHRTKAHKNVQVARMRVTKKCVIATLSKEDIQDNLEKAEIADLLESMVSKVVSKTTGPNPFGHGRSGAATRTRVGIAYKGWSSQLSKVKEVEDLTKSKGISFTQACAELEVPASNVTKWRKRKSEFAQSMKVPAKRYSRRSRFRTSAPVPRNRGGSVSTLRTPSLKRAQ